MTANRKLAIKAQVSGSVPRPALVFTFRNGQAGQLQRVIHDPFPPEAADGSAGEGAAGKRLAGTSNPT